MSALRRIARGVAKNRMKRKGYVQFCKHGERKGEVGGFDSPFSKKWKTEVNWHGAGVSKTG